MKEANARHVLVVFDSCFSGTIFHATRAALPAAISRYTTLPVRQFVTSGTSGQKVSDDGQFRRLFIGAITGLEPEANPNRDAYVTGNELGNFLQQKVTNLSSGRQTPLFGPMNEQGYDQGDFVFQVREEPETTTAAIGDQVVSAPMEQRFWTFVSKRKDAALIEDYLRAFPETPFRTIAVAELGALRGGSKPAAPAAAPQGDFDTVTVFYGTDRKALAAGDDYGSDRGRALSWGEAKVTVPRAHMGNQIERPWAIKIPYYDVSLSQQAEDPKQHFTLQSIKADDAQLSKIKTSLQGTESKKDALVYVHGYNTSFKSALFRAAQLAYDLNFKGPVFVYSWPSGGTVSAYTFDRESVEQAEPYFRQFLQTISGQNGIDKIHVVAHSLGNQLLVSTLADIGKSADPKAFRIGQVVFAAADVDRDLFEARCAAFSKSYEGGTVYASSNDRALVAANRLQGTPRAGEVPATGPLVLPCVDTIDVTASSTDALSISGADLLSDMGRLLKTGQRPPDKRSPELKPVTTDKGVYWRYSPG
jgi:esterase/lipase superfamily enzyme